MQNYSKRLFLIGITVITACLSTKSLSSAENVTFCDKPTVTNSNGKTLQNPYCLGNRAPLQPLYFQKLPLGAVQPKGWIAETFERQRTGLCGNLGEISQWLEKDGNAWLAQGGEHGWEEVPYWLRGYASMAFLSKNQKMIDETMLWIEAIFKSQRTDGWFGPEVRRHDNAVDIWPNMIVLYVLQDYYEFSGDKRVFDFMKKYYAFLLTVPEREFLRDYWENCRQGDNIFSVLWYYNHTGDKDVLSLIEKLHKYGTNWCRISDLPNWHNVNIAQGFREPAMYYTLSGNPSDLAAAYNNHDLIRRTFGQVPGGMFGSDENCRMGRIDPRQGIETCAIVEQMTSDEMMLRLTGDTFWAENCEDVLFNTFHAAFMPDMRSLHYITSPNMVLCDRHNHSPGIDNRGPFLIMNPLSCRCCQHNHGFGIPYYIQNLWLASPDKGLAVALYNASTVTAKVGDDATEVTFQEESNYPFEETIHFTLTTLKAVDFPFYLRVPAWCKQIPILTINGKNVPLDIADKKAYLKIDRTWNNGDKVAITFPMQFSVRTWQVNQNSVSVDYGPLTFSLQIKMRFEKVSSSETAIGDSGWQKNADQMKWPAWEIYPDSDWNYGLVVDQSNPDNSLKLIRKEWPRNNFPFEAGAVPFEVEAVGRKIPGWEIDEYGLCGILPRYPVPTAEPQEKIKLIPMGATQLRISSFPEVDAK